MPPWGSYHLALIVFTMPWNLHKTLVSLAFPYVVAALNNGVGVKPAMGWNPYNAFACSATEAMYHTQAQSIVSLGLLAVGYQYINLDCGWQATSRDSAGKFQWSNKTLPAGVPALATFVHNLGLKFGVYTDLGVFACDTVGGTAHFIGSLGHETSDVASYASRGADYVDNCFAVNSTDFVDFDPPISVRWDNIFRIMNQVVPITGFAARFNDLDMLEVGNSGLTTAEQRTHFAFWAATKSPLIISTDLTKAYTQTLNILKNTRIISLNQDALGKSIAFKRRYTNDHDVWSGPLSDGSTVALVINWQDSSRSLTFNLADVGFSSATATDLITGTSLGKVTTSITQTVAAHGSMVLKLTNGVAAPTSTFTFYPAASGTLAGGANTRVVNSSITVVGFVGNGGTLLSFDYINGDFTFSNTACSNCRNTFVSVNGGTAVQVQMPISAQSWDILLSGYLVSLPGFRAGKTNTITLSNPSAFTPDFYRVGVAV
ncbi:alpha-galactosidase [Favolaschia claudopus]|uniref:Alpha-galactosidase n=1 Tax=Favolaschia claudopus TaxID=2862362 RepID=A0AAW0A1C7_9AGAR